MIDTTALRAALARDYLTQYPGEAAALLEERPVADLAAVLEQSPLESAAPIFAALTPVAAKELLAGLSCDRAVGLVRAMDPARAAALCGRLASEDQSRLLEGLPPAEARELHELMMYPADCAAGLMTTDVATFRPETTAAGILARLRADRAVGITDVALVDSEGYLAGMVPVTSLIAAEPDATALQLAREEHLAVQAMTPREDVVEAMTRARITIMPVVDVQHRLLGVVGHDQLAPAIESEASAGVQTMVGASEDEQALSPVGFAVRKRLPWLQINLLTAFLAATVVGVFEDTIARVTALAVLLPVVAGQSGNTGSQALAVTIRGLALREVRLRHWRKVAAKESAVGLINGLGVALTTAAGVYLWSRSAGLTAVIASSMVLSMMVAGLAGAIIPMGLTAARQDPAQSSSIVLTTVTDIVGFLSFLGIASLLMDWL